MLNFDSKIYLILGAAFRVQKELRNGLQEPLYQEALKMELDLRGIPNEREVFLPVFYRGAQLSKTYRMDFICFDDIIVELKSIETIAPDCRNQLFNYMRITKKNYGILLNFGPSRLQSEYYYRDEESNMCRTYKFSIDLVSDEIKHFSLE